MKIEDDYSEHRSHIMNMFKDRTGYLTDEQHSHVSALWRLPISKYLAENYETLSSLSTQYSNNTPLNSKIDTPVKQAMVDLLVEKQLLKRQNGKLFPKDSFSAQYLGGVWLEELAWAAVLEAGADAAIYGQRIHWSEGEFGGQNEIDVIAAFGEKITFISCKALRPYIDSSIDKSRYRNLKIYLHEADDLADHFGIEGDKVIYLTTVDMIAEENNNRHRHSSLAGKAKALDVHLMGLEQISWPYLVKAIKASQN